LSDARASYTLLFDPDGEELGTFVVYASGARRLALDPRPYLKVDRGWKIPPRIWPLFDSDGKEAMA